MGFLPSGNFWGLQQGCCLFIVAFWESLLLFQHLHVLKLPVSSFNILAYCGLFAWGSGRPIACFLVHQQILLPDLIEQHTSAGPIPHTANLPLI
jgi:hypothetical protein